MIFRSALHEMNPNLKKIYVWPIILNFDQATHVYLIQNESYQQSPEKTKNNGEHERQY